MKFKSKIDARIWAFFFLFPLTGSVSALVSMFIENLLELKIAFALIGGFLIGLGLILLPFMRNTGYTIDKYELILKCGYFKKVIKFDDIVDVKYKKMPLHHPRLYAFSTETLVIYYKDPFGDLIYVLVSPAQRQEFIHKLHYSMAIVCPIA
jgi:hypothetical protein